MTITKIKPIIEHIYPILEFVLKNPYELRNENPSARKNRATKTFIKGDITVHKEPDEPEKNI
ncbi:hypothetical protein ACFLQN_04165 [Candidatus Aenigmatarchaeota archaeon]